MTHQNKTSPFSPDRAAWEQRILRALAAQPSATWTKRMIDHAFTPWHIRQYGRPPARFNSL
jgi:hypothetical protein